ncbi:MAG: aminopeptidase P family protein [Rhodospirillales bacterium]|nr:aminopeptidase P family protein [Rhodospirillales bacterium]
MSEFEKRLGLVREEIARLQLDGYIIPRTDEFLGEYVPACAERLAWLTGFDGSAGIAAVLPDRAVVMSDGRYTLQLEQQVNRALYEAGDMYEAPLSDWLRDHAEEGARIGYDPMLFTPPQIESLSKAPVELVAVEGNLIDAVWNDRPAPPLEAVEMFPDEMAGKTAGEKRTEISASLEKEGLDAFVLTAPESVSWLLNVRGADVPHIPVVLSYAIIYAGGRIDWFVDPGKQGADVLPFFPQEVFCHDISKLSDNLLNLKDKVVGLDYKRSSVWFRQVLTTAGAQVKDIEDPCIEPRACKNEAERAAITETHIRDGVALVRFLKWVDEQGPKKKLTELDIVAKREECSRLDPLYREASFDTIAGWADNGAVVHYRVTKETNKPIKPPGLLLVDSGGQYCGGGVAGTTDVTRTVAIGEPTDDMRENFTRVLKGHIGVATARFPEGTTGGHIDALARKPLWDVGRDYDHGTGHGVGCYLSVHEEAAGISKRAGMPFKAGMLISNEPGYYKAGEYGIRIESLVFVVEDGLREDTDKKMLAFETVTMAPIDRNLIDPVLLSASETKWLNAYHRTVYETLAPRLESDVAAWLEQACTPL